jgi:hypothetical protein
MSCFQREHLPPAKTFYERECGQLSRPSREWAKALCPFHPDNRPSLSINLRTGGFNCFACQARGGDAVDFLILRYGYDFRTACQKLGVWREDNKSSKPLPRRLAPWLVMDFTIDGVEYRASVRDEPRNYADKIRRFYREASDRLVELSHGDSETYAGEQESCWDRMACALDELRELETV